MVSDAFSMKLDRCACHYLISWKCFYLPISLLQKWAVSASRLFPFVHVLFQMRGFFLIACSTSVESGHTRFLSSFPPVTSLLSQPHFILVTSGPRAGRSKYENNILRIRIHHSLLILYYTTTVNTLFFVSNLQSLILQFQ